MLWESSLQGGVSTPQPCTPSLNYLPKIRVVPLVVGSARILDILISDTVLSVARAYPVGGAHSVLAAAGQQLRTRLRPGLP
jgi:hypothetical protein